MKKYIVFAIAVLVFGVVVSATAGQGRGCNGGCNCARGGGSARMYDAAKTETVTGQVVSLEPTASRQGNCQGIGLTLNTGAENMMVHLGPQWFLDHQTVKLIAGDTVEITGSKAFRRGEAVFIAAEIKKGNEVLKLRDAGGVPAWAGLRCGDNRPGV
jgi:Tfp pilus assembly protein PilZ